MTSNINPILRDHFRGLGNLIFGITYIYFIHITNIIQYHREKTHQKSFKNKLIIIRVRIFLIAFIR